MKFLAYNIEVAICLSIFYIIYIIFFKRETFFQINRYVLLAAVGLSLAIPLIEFSAEASTVGFIQPIALETQINEIIIYASTDTSSSFELSTMINLAYYAGFSISLLILIFAFLRLLGISAKAHAVMHLSTKVYLIDDKHNPFTFMNKIFINQSLIGSDGLSEVIRHEKVHSEQRHSLDILILELVKIIQWFNPVIYLINRELRELHEYIADTQVVGSSDKNSYINTMLSLTLGATVSDLANNFNGIKLIKRLKMITKPASTKSAAMKYILLLPAIAVLVLAFSCKDKVSEPETSSELYENIYPWLDDGKVPMFLMDTSKSSERKVKDPNKIYVEKYPNPIGMIEDQILGEMKTHQKWLNENKAGKVSLRYKVSRTGEVSDPIITNWKMADDKNWTRKKLPIEIEKDILQAVVKSKIKYEPAIKDGKAIDGFAGTIFVIGSQAVWNKFNMGGDVYYQMKGEKGFKGVNIPYEKSKEKNKVGEAMISPEQLRFISYNLKYPEQAIKNNIEGTVIITFEVDSKGTVVDAKVETVAR